MRFANVFELGRAINTMRPGELLTLDRHEVAMIRYNDWIYGSFDQALRGHVMGSSFGTLEIIRALDGDAVTFAKREGGERVYDRDGLPIQSWPADA